MKTKLRRIVYWLLSIIIFVGSPELVMGESSELKVEEQQRKDTKKKKAVKKKVEKRVEKPKAARVQVPPPPPPVPHFNSISKEDFVSGKHKQLTIPYIEGGIQKYGVGTYNSGRYIIARDLGINADATTYDYWKSK